MRNLLTKLLIVICLPIYSVAQNPSVSQNYVMETTVKVSGKKTLSAIIGLPVDSINRTFSYVDGLGRPLQTVGWQASPKKRDMVTFHVYDGLGRESTKYLPYAEQTGNDASYKAAAQLNQQLFYENTGWDQTVVKTPHPVSRMIFEASPLSRVLEKGAPGDSWQPFAFGSEGAGHTVKIDYGTNVVGDDVYKRSFAPNGSVIGMGSIIEPGSLSKTTIKDENWVTGKAGTIDEFKDKLGRVVLKRVWETGTKKLDTYYGYDDRGNLRYVMPPAVNESGTHFKNFFYLVDTEPNFHLIYLYEYDQRDRMVRNKIPGKGWEEMIYNLTDQVVFTQDAVQRGNAERSFIKYDALGRTVMTGVVSGSNGTRDEVQITLNALTTTFESRDNASGNYHGYNNLSYPSNLTNLEPLVVNYYDNYAVPGIPYQPAGYSSMTLGLQTATKVKVLGSADKWLWTVFCYDDKGKMVRTWAQNNVAGTDINDYTYNFSGELIASNRTHSVGGVSTVIANTYNFDHMGRKLGSTQNINGQGLIRLNNMEYNEIGQLAAKGLHGFGSGTVQGANIQLNESNTVFNGQQLSVTASSSITLLPGFHAHEGSNFLANISPMLQRTVYTYNERGWLKTSTSNEFNMQLDYETGTYPQFNGNISHQRWGSGFSNVFTYQYDKLNRLVNGSTTAGTVAMGEILNYDEMGNITSLTRSDGISVKSGTYNYNGNQLSNITNGQLATGTYQYDLNGNAKIDGRTGAELEFNLLNLPKLATIGNISVAYTYDATGQKLKKVSSTTGTTDYVNGIHYTNGAIDFIQTEEGRAVKDVSGNYRYEYNLADHLGNVRISFDIYQNALRIVQRDDYYAFGLRKSGLNGNGAVSLNNKYLYNGKEIQEELLGQYDYGARFYDPVIGRWNVVDPLAEYYDDFSPYNYVLNNPINFIDPDGTWVDKEPEGFRSTTIDEKGRIIEHKNDDGDNSVYQLVNGNKVKIGTEIEGIDYNQLIGQQLNIMNYNPNPIKLDPVAITARRPTDYIRAKEFSFWERVSMSDNFIYQLGYKMLDEPYITYTQVFDVVNGPRHLDQSGAGRREIEDAGISTLLLLAPLNKVKALIPKLNIAQFSKLTKGSSLARLSPAKRGFVTKATNKATGLITVKTFIQQSRNSAKKINQP